MIHDEFSICVALLHDVVEDTDMTIEDISNFGFPIPVNFDRLQKLLMLYLLPPQ